VWYSVQMVKEEQTLEEVYEKYSDGNISPIEHSVEVELNNEYF